MPRGRTHNAVLIDVFYLFQQIGVPVGDPSTLPCGTRSYGGPSHERDAGSLDGDIRVLPTHQDIEPLILWVEEIHCRDIQKVREEVSTLAEQMDTGEASVSSLEL